VQVETWYSWWRGFVNVCSGAVVYRRQCGGRSYPSGHAKHQYLARRVERATHLGGNRAERLDGVQVVLPELAIEAGIVAGYLSAQGGGRGGFEGVEWKDGRGTKRWLVDMLDCGRELFLSDRDV